MTLLELVWLAGWALWPLCCVGGALWLYFAEPYPDDDLVLVTVVGAVGGILWPVVAAVGLPWLALHSLHRRVHPQTRIPTDDSRQVGP